MLCACFRGEGAVEKGKGEGGMGLVRGVTSGGRHLLASPFTSFTWELRSGFGVAKYPGSVHSRAESTW